MRSELTEIRKSTNGKFKKHLIGLAIVVLSATIIASCGGSGGGQATTEDNEASEVESSSENDAPAVFTIAMTDNAFAPMTFNAKVGQEVEFVLDNKGVAVHNMVVEGTEFKSDMMINPGMMSSFKAKFSKPGVYRLVCVYHQPQMSAEIVVED